MLLALLLAIPDALLNRPYTPEPHWERVSVRCAMPLPYTRLVSGTLPPGIRMTGRGTLEGTPTVPGRFAFTVEVSDGCDRRLEPREIQVLAAPILVAEAETQQFHCVQGAPPFSGGLVRVSGSVPGRAYSVDILHAPWLQATMRDGVLPPEGSALEADTLQLTVDPGKLAPGSYSGRLRLSTWQGANTPELRFQLHVASPQTVLAPIAAAPSPVSLQPNLPDVASPSIRLIVPPVATRPAPPQFPKHKPRPKPPQPSGARSTGRSRVLPFPKVVLEPKPAAPKEVPPERTKPSAMPPPAAKH